ncbi:hypothetical protein D9613_009788 [Agrocybe pediades]|uniref:Uncharacterized protein n=1 Tax=Agrocybe pediades TaxID=84607 RepID=A0A8H4QYE4_9AGAR|nr:hypothetical protein D9613_009788 [Agrocybe pediades]
MPFTFKVASHDASKVEPPYYPMETADELLARTWGEKAKTRRSKELLQSSLINPDFPKDTRHPQRGLPDDVWIAILGQFSFYVNAHVEELRSRFVAHDGKRELVVNADGTRYTVNFGSLARQMTDLIHNNVVDKDLKDWILPDFSTTTEKRHSHLRRADDGHC